MVLAEHNKMLAEWLKDYRPASINEKWHLACLTRHIDEATDGLLMDLPRLKGDKT